jgi:hypothetical protein
MICGKKYMRYKKWNSVVVEDYKNRKMNRKLKKKRGERRGGE